MAGTSEPYQVLSNEILAVGQEMFRANDLAMAEKKAQQALAAYPANGSAYILLGEIAAKQEDQGEAGRYFRAAISIDPADRAAYVRLGKASLALDDLNAAQETLAQLEQLCTACEEYQQLSGLIQAHSTKAD